MYHLRILISVLLFFHCGFLFPQKQTNIWYFGNGIGLDFNVQPPRLLTDGKIFPNEIGHAESAASISDAKGNLIFYTDGVTVWNRLHQSMPNGNDLWGSGTTTQTIIIPQPGNVNLYYVFTASPQGDDIYFPVDKKGFRYSLIDLSLDGGYGAVIEKNTLLVSSNTEKIAATLHANGKDVWVVMHEWKSKVFHCFLITELGLQMRSVSSELGAVHEKEKNYGGILSASDVIGQMKFSPNGEKLALVLRESMTVEIFDFDNATGQLAHPITSSNFELSLPLYGIEFSPNSEFLYLHDKWFIHQISIEALPKKVVTRLGNEFPKTGNEGSLQMASNGKIYVAQGNSIYFGVINYPNIAGTACDYIPDAISTTVDGINYRCNSGLPNFISSYFLDDQLYPPKPYVEMPNVITPNEDGFNDSFVPMNYYRVDVANLSIYNRWGQMIYETREVTKGWDGGNSPAGVYYWALEFSGTNKKYYHQKGFVHVLQP